MGLVDHAQTELGRAGLFDKDSDYGGRIGKAVLQLVKVFADQGHSGFSASLTLHVFGRVARFKTLTAITSDPEEWMDVSQHQSEDARPLWQNRRQPSIFSKDGGKTHYDLDKEGSASNNANEEKAC